MSIRFAVLAAILASAACTSRHMVIPDHAVSSGATEFSQATLLVRNFEAKGASRADDPAAMMPDLRASFAEYITARCKFGKVLFGATAAARDPAVAVDVVMDADHSSYRTWVLDYLGLNP